MFLRFLDIQPQSLVNRRATQAEYVLEDLQVHTDDAVGEVTCS